MRKNTSRTRQGKPQKVVETPWLDGYEGAEYAGDGYRPFLQKLENGTIRAVKDGRKWKTRKDWIDDYLLGLEQTGMLERG